MTLYGTRVTSTGNLRYSAGWCFDRSASAAEVGKTRLPVRCLLRLCPSDSIQQKLRAWAKSETYWCWEVRSSTFGVPTRGLVEPSLVVLTWAGP